MQLPRVHWIYGVTIFSAGLIFGLGLAGLASPGNASILAVKSIRDNDPEYKFISPLLAVDVTLPDAAKTMQLLKDRLIKLISSPTIQDEADAVSVYVRQSSTSWFEINGDEKFSPASLLKVPTLIAFFKKSESDPTLFDRRVYYDGSFDDNQAEYFKSKEVIKAGNYYTIRELLRYLVVGSDNNANRLLHENIDEKYLDDVYQDLGLPVPQLAATDSITAKDYSYFFRILYNATYLNRANSEKVLQLLSEIDFPYGIRGGIPGTVIASQKFGERSVSHFDKFGNTVVDYKELHDCGIVWYRPKQLYILCVMTKGQDLLKMADALTQISKATYDWMVSQ